LKAGDQVVTAGMRLSRDGQPVRIVQPGAVLEPGQAPNKGSDKAGPASAKAG
jgi:hypothetical protein